MPTSRPASSVKEPGSITSDIINPWANLSSARRIATPTCHRSRSNWTENDRPGGKSRKKIEHGKGRDTFWTNVLLIYRCGWLRPQRLGVALFRGVFPGGTFDYQIPPRHKFRSHVFLRDVSLSPRLLGSADATETGTKPGDTAAADESCGLICLRLKHTSLR